MTRRIAAWCLGIGAVLLFAGAIPPEFASAEPDPALRLLWPTPFLGMALVGTLVALRRSDNFVGWAFLVAGSLMVANSFAGAYTRYSLAHDLGLPAGDLVAWLAFWLWMPATVFVGVALVIFPTGRGSSSLWRWVVRAELGLVLILIAAALPTFSAPPSVLIDASTPSEVPGGTVLGALANGPVTLVLPIGFIAIVIRFVRSRGIERQQMKWFVFGASILALATLIMFLLPVEDPIDHPLGFGSIGIGMTAIPVSAGIAITRYRLFDIDRIISRTASYALITAILACTYAFVALVPTAILGTGDVPDGVVAAATLVVAAAFIPVRRRVQRAVDRRFNRARYDATQAVEVFAARLRDEVDIDTLSSDLQTLVHHTMEPTHVSLWLRTHQ